MSGGYHGDAEPMEVEEEVCGAWGVVDSGYPDPCGQSGQLGQQEQPSAFPMMPRAQGPNHWRNVPPGMSVLAAVVEPNTEEYVKVAFHFHSSLPFPDYEIMRLYRIQNPFLWQHYILKQQEMQAEDGGREVAERCLFHGTRVANIDAICRKGFDWRVCGRHGTMYGQGCYFARDSRYSHRYSPKSSDPRDRCDVLQSAVVSQSAATPAPVSQSQLAARGAVWGTPAGSNQTGSSGFGPFTAGVHSTAGAHNLVSDFSLPVLLQRDGCTPHPAGFSAQRDGWTPPTLGFSAQTVSASGFGCQGSRPREQFFPQRTEQTELLSQRLPGQQKATHNWPNGLHHMFLARVLVGKVVRGHADYRRPPAIHPGDPLSRQYDCCVDSPQDPKIFVVFDSNQTYPEYVVEYKLNSKIT